jgi:hypothetical protein
MGERVTTRVIANGGAGFLLEGSAVRATIIACVFACTLSACNTTAQQPPLVWNDEMERHMGPQMDAEDAIEFGVMDGILDAEMMR